MSAPVTIERIAAGGDGIGHLPDGRAVFVPRTAPGDVATLTDVRLHQRFARARLGTLQAPTPHRVTPRCAHYDRDQCGGCQLQHLDETGQQAARRAIIGDALRRIGKLDQPDPPLTTASPPWHYRHRITLHADAGAQRIGFHALGEGARVFDLERCEIAAEPLNALWTAIRGSRQALPPALTDIVLRLSRAGHAHVVLRGPVRPSAESLAQLAAATASLGTPVSWWWEGALGAMRCLAGGPGNEPGDAASFEQVNPAAGDLVRQQALARFGPLAGSHAWDLYAGSGDATRGLLAAGATVESVEQDSAAVAAAERAGPATGARRYHGAVEEWVGRLSPPAVVYTNPPRTGMSPEVVDRLAAVGPRTIMYVSCDPATLARDLRRLGAAYHIRAVQGYDLFPQTAHVETVVHLERA